jgi:hypothetical protein
MSSIILMPFLRVKWFLTYYGYERHVRIQVLNILIAGGGESRSRGNVAR